MKKREKQLRYLSQALQLEEAVNPAIIRTTMMTVSIAIISFTVWSGFTNINEVARTPGEVVPSGYQQVVQHLEGGIVSRIDVAEGDVVEEGQTLVELDGAGITEDLDRARAKKTALLMQEERLRAYIERRQPDFAPFGTGDNALIRDQKNFFSSMESANREERQIVTRQIEQKKRAIASLQAELDTEERNLEISAQLFERKSELHEKGYLSETRFLETQKSMNDVRGRISSLKSRLGAAASEIGEYENRLSSLGLGQNDKVNERLDAILIELSQHEEILHKLEEKSKRLDVRAPVRGIVKGLAVNTIGAIVKPGDTLMEIVPVDNELVVQVKIPPQHIGHVKPGQPVKVKLSSYDFSRYGLVNGRLEQISATTFSGENGDRYYQGRIKLDHNYVGTDKRNPVIPGMTVMAEIITGRKTILQYLLKPIHNSLKTAFTER